MNNESNVKMHHSDASSTSPKVSVILAVYNAAPYLRQCLDSIVAQTLKDIEIICVDDASDDSSLLILKEYQEKDSRITVIEQEHSGAAAARNKGLALAKGEYLSILDSDDFFEPDMLEEAYNASKLNDADITVFQANFFNHREKRFEPCDYSLRLNMLPENNPFSAADISDRIFNIGCGWAWDKLFKRSFVESSNIQFQNIRTSNDMLFVFYLYSRASRIYVLRKLFAHQRINAGESLSVTRERSWQNFYLALMALKERLIEDGTYETFRHSFVNWALNFTLWNIDTLKCHARRQLKSKCREEYFEKLDILNNDKSYFLYDFEYERLLRIMNEGAAPKVTVIMPVYNAEKYLRKSLDTLCAQTLSEIQIICVNDGSTDSSADILSEYEERDDRILVITTEHTNAGDSRNAGIKIADGEYLSFLDADDFFEPDMLETAFNHAAAHGSDVCLFRSNQYDDSSDTYIDTPWTLRDWEMPEHRPFSAKDAAKKIFNMSSCTAWDKLFRRDFIVKEKLCFQSTPICNDMLFTFSALSLAERITTIQNVLIHQRIRHEKKLAVAFELCTSCYYYALYGLKEFLCERGLYENYKKSFVNWALDFSLFTMHSFVGSFQRLVRQQLKLRNFKTLDIFETPEEDFYNYEQYTEMLTIMDEYKETNKEEIPVVSVVMPIYNLERYLKMSLDTVVFQTLENIEIICVDDGSTDRTLEILKEYRSIDSRIQIICQNNMGAGAARNRGLEQAKGKFTIFLDGDDVFDSELLEKTVERAVETDADIVAFNFTQTDAQGNYAHRVGIHTEFLFSEKEVFNYSDCPDRIMTVVNPTPWNKLFKTDFIRNNNLKYEEITSSNDITFAAVSVATAEKISYLKDELLHYNRGLPGSITAHKHDKMHNVITAITSAVEQVQKLPYADELQESIIYFVVDNIVFSLQNNVRDIHDESAKNFYNFAHDYLNGKMFDDVDEEILDRDLYAKYRVIKEVSYESLVKAYDTERIVSITSYPARIAYAAEAVKSLMEQTIPADRIILCLAECQFPEKEDGLPEDLMELVKSGELELLWCDEDLGPHKKYYYTMQKYPDAIVITADDDLLYPNQTIEALFRGYLLYPNAVSAVRTHLIAISEKGNILPYNDWIMEYDKNNLIPSRQLIAIGVGGILYPPGLLCKEIFNKEIIKKTCLRADDLWLKTMECVSGIPVVCVSEKKNLHYVPGSQETALWKSNVDRNQNDIQMKKIIKWTDIKFGKNHIIDYISNDPELVSWTEILYLKNKRLEQKINDAERQVNMAKGQLSDVKIITNLSRLGLSRGSSIYSVYEKMPNKSIVICESGELKTSDLPSKFGIVYMVKLSGARGYIQFYSKDEGGDARMYILGSGTPSGVWHMDFEYVPKKYRV